MIADAGGANTFADAERQFPRVSDEAVRARGPDLVTPDHGGAGLRDGSSLGWRE